MGWNKRFDFSIFQLSRFLFEEGHSGYGVHDCGRFVKVDNPAVLNWIEKDFKKAARDRPFKSRSHITRN